MHTDCFGDKDHSHQLLQKCVSCVLCVKFVPRADMREVLSFLSLGTVVFRFYGAIRNPGKDNLPFFRIQLNMKYPSLPQ